MPDQVNIADEIAAVCARLSQGETSLHGAEYLASQFGVEPWSQPFFEILSAITRRLDELASIIDQTATRPALRDLALSHIKSIGQAFAKDSLMSQWDRNGLGYVSAPHRDPIQAMAGSLHQFDYDQPTPEQIAELFSLAGELRGWLLDHQLEEQDFIRACLIDGLDRFMFRLEKFEWIGWGYTLESLREVIGAYLTLQGKIDPDQQSVAAAALRKFSAFLAKTSEFVSGAREGADNLDAVAKVLKATAHVAAPTATYIAGLLTN